MCSTLTGHAYVEFSCDVKRTICMYSVPLPLSLFSKATFQWLSSERFVCSYKRKLLEMSQTSPMEVDIGRWKALSTKMSSVLYCLEFEISVYAKFIYSLSSWNRIQDSIIYYCRIYFLPQPIFLIFYIQRRSFNLVFLLVYGSLNWNQVYVWLFPREAFVYGRINATSKSFNTCSLKICFS